jgi:sulfite exporter TauE/SafE
MSEYTFYYAALLLGFLGSFHCVGMCGPIALMLPANKLDNRSVAFFGRLTYNIGRMITYMFIGMLFGLLGAAFVLNGFQKQLSIISGVILLLVAVFTLIPSTRKKVLGVSSKINIPFRGVLKKLFSGKTTLHHFGIGVINGFLPCGFVYVATAGAINSGSVLNSVMYMAFFGLGTFPVMLLVSYAASWCNFSLSHYVTKATPWISAALALFLIYRGTFMNINSDCHKHSHPPVMIECSKPEAL